MKALILAAGYATRLYPLTKDYPKALLVVDDKPIIGHIIEKLEKIPAIDEIIVVTNSKFISQFRKWQRGLKSSKPVTLVDDLTKDNASRLGAIGDINFAVNKLGIKDDLLVIGGDNLFDSGLKDFLVFIRANKSRPVLGAYRLKNKAEAKRYGVVKLGRDNRLVDFAEKPEKPKSALVAMCLYYLPKGKLGLVKAYMRSKKEKLDATGRYIDWLRKKVAVYGFIFEGHWYDIGEHKFYNEAKEVFAK
jgi:glucose-1-phosphate thymidylyltransferase